MEKFSKYFFSMRMMAVAMFVFLVAIAWATLLESMYDIQTARIVVYNALWFESLLVYLGINLIANIYRYRMFRREKIATLMFHLAFILMLIGAGITRYISFEGLMIIKEGSESDFIYSSEPYLWIKINDGKKQYTYQKQLYLSEATDNYFDFNVDFPGHNSKITIAYADFKKNLVDTLLINDTIDSYVLEIVTNGMEKNYLAPGDLLPVGPVTMTIGKGQGGFEVFKTGNQVNFKSAAPLRSVAMSALQNPGQAPSDSLYVEIPADTLVTFETATLYQFTDGSQFVFKGVLEHAAKTKMPGKVKNAGTDHLTLNISDGSYHTKIALKGGKDAVPEHELFELNGLVYEMEYGSIRIPLPFKVACRDFQLDRYPGSESPSSFASEVTIIDTEKNYKRDQRIFMNNVMDYRGYRFFQSSYEPDESGTRLSVNHDWWGTNISYLGYLMMGIGMLLSLFAKNGRFRELNAKIKKSKALHHTAKMMFFTVLIVPFGFAQDSTSSHDHDHDHDHPAATHQADIQPKVKPTFQIMSEAHSDEIASLMVQDISGRIIPFHTLCDQLLRKVYRSDKFKSYNAVQTVMSMHMHPDYWMGQPVIYVSGKSDLRTKVMAKDGYVSFDDLNDEQGNFILLEDYRKAHQMLESKRGEYEKQLIKLAEKYEVMQSIFSWRFMKLIPVASDPAKTWHSPLNLKLLEVDTTGIKTGIRYLAALDEATKNKNYSIADRALNDLKAFQRSEGKDVVPAESKIAMEIRYNKMHIFKNSYRTYLALGVIALILYFIRIFVPKKDRSEQIFKRIGQGLVLLTGVIFVYHGYGLYMRWAISGHAPWSNGYEAVVFIAWATVLTGLIFSRKNAVIIGATAILASLMIFVTEMNLMDPEITPLQPVLKSYWLMIHVAVITGSYGPLGISCILGMLSLVLYTVRTKKNGKLLTMHINELTYVAEMTMTIGLFMLTIGTFLGGIWANESWGRYWGWDPKETWALVAILVYAVILHLRYIPGLNGKFLFNAVSMWGYASILFTFFGVNFYLVGLHSYAQGEGLGKIPNEIIYAVIGFVLFNALAYLRYRNYTRNS